MIWFFCYVLAGAGVGVLAGLLGIGGGMTLVPVIAILFAAQNFAPDHVVHMALATCMASIAFTSVPACVSISSSMASTSISLSE
jgi:uncharacterized membrane protein YfcA